MSIPCVDNNGNIFASKSAFKVVYGTTEGAFELAKNSIDAGVLSNITNEPANNNSNIFPIIVATAIISSLTTYVIIKAKEHKTNKSDNENNERSYIYAGV